MEEIKQTIGNLEQALVKLENALHQTKKDKEQALSEIVELKSVIRKTYTRLDGALSAFHQDQGSE